MSACTHLTTDRPAVAPDPAAGCGDCLREGSQWVHLRMCLDCGQVSCCDSSPRRHATAHARSTEHPVVQSREPGESWRWCYADEVLAP